MPRKKLTDRFVEHAPIPAAGRIEYFDMLLPGFCLRVTSDGAKSWCVFYRVRGRLRRHTLERWPRLKLADARDVAREAIKRAAKGEDPAAEKKRLRAGDGTVKAVSATFVTRYCKQHQLRSWQETERILEVDVEPTLGARQITNVTKRDVLDLIDKVSDRAPMAGRNVFKVLRKLFRWAAERDVIAANPIAGIKPPTPDTKRDRVLTDDEIRAIWPKCDELGPPFGPLVRFLLLTGQRRSECAEMTWAEVEGDTWTIPAERYKTGKPHAVPLSKAAKAILDAQARVGEPPRYPFTTDGESPFQGFTKLKAALDEKSAVTGWTLHDLRRTARTLMSRAGVPSDHAERVVGHVVGGVRGVYDLHEYAKEKRAALETLATMIELILSRPARRNVEMIETARAKRKQRALMKEVAAQI
jgi:integrase